MKDSICSCGDPECPGSVPIHWPFAVRCEAVGPEPGEFEFYGTVRTSSWEFDGERTDIHDVLSLLWAAALRAQGVTSSRLVTEMNAFSGIDSEIYSRLLVFEQLGTLENLRIRPAAELLSAQSKQIHELIAHAFDMPPAWSVPIDDVYGFETDAEWIPRLEKFLRCGPASELEVRVRGMPAWTYFRSYRQGVTAVELTERATERLRAGLCLLNTVEAPSVEHLLFRTGAIRNGAPNRTLAVASKIAKLIEGKTELLIIPTESHLIAIGRRSLIAIQRDCGNREFDESRRTLEARRAQEARLLQDDLVFTWRDKIDDGRFETLVLALLGAEPGIQRVRQVGATRERDGGRDLVADWHVVPNRSGVTLHNVEASLRRPATVLVQIKAKGRGVNLQDLGGIRDTLEHYQCDGLLVVAFPRITVPLHDHLDRLRTRPDLWVDWWNQAEIEDRLRRHPEVLVRFPDLVVGRSPESMTNAI